MLCLFCDNMKVKQYVSLNPSASFEVCDWRAASLFSQNYDEQQRPHNGKLLFLICTFPLNGRLEMAFTIHKTGIMSHDTTIRALNVSYDI